MLRVGREYEFAAAHFLPSHKGKCRGMHGHNYRVIVEVKGEQILEQGFSSSGMVVDFGDLDAFVKPLIEHLDHKILNDELPPGFMPPTAENVVAWLVTRLEQECDAHRFKLSCVRVYETPKSYAEWRKGK